MTAMSSAEDNAAARQKNVKVAARQYLSRVLSQGAVEALDSWVHQVSQRHVGIKQLTIQLHSQ